MEGSSESWDTHALLRNPLDQYRSVCRPTPRNEGPRRSAAASRVEGQQPGPPRGAQEGNSREHFRRRTIQPPCAPCVGSFTQRRSSSPPPLGIADSWRCFSASSSREVQESGDESDASCDSEVASLTHGRRLGLEPKEACLPSGPRGAAMGNLFPIVSPSREIEAAESSGLLSLLSPSAHFTVTPSPTDGVGTRAGDLETRGKISASCWGGPARPVGRSGCSAAGIEWNCGGGLSEHREVKRQRIEMSRCQTPS